MSPDPPRDSASDDNGLNGGPHNFYALNEEDMGEGDHELDFSSHESEMTSDEEDVHNLNEAEGLNEGDGNTRVRAQYQMLIPFANATEGGDNDGVQEFHANSPMDDDDTDDEEAEPTPQAVAAPAPTSEEPNAEVAHQNTVKREINLSNEKVETIKDVMKNFTLPSASIPLWAQEVSEDEWKSKLIGKIGNDTASVADSTNNKIPTSAETKDNASEKKNS